jgi:hypothetical protein
MSIEIAAYMALKRLQESGTASNPGCGPILEQVGQLAGLGHDCGRFLWKADPPIDYGYIKCSCGSWYRRGWLEFWTFLFNWHVHPHRAGRGVYWYRTTGPGCRP